MVLNNADRVCYGAVAAQRIYLGSNLVWDNQRTETMGTAFVVLTGDGAPDEEDPDALLMYTSADGKTTALPVTAGFDSLLQAVAKGDSTPLPRITDTAHGAGDMESASEAFAAGHTYGMVFARGLAEMLMAISARPNPVDTVHGRGTATLPDVTGIGQPRPTNTVYGRGQCDVLDYFGGSATAVNLGTEHAFAVASDQMTISALPITKKWCTVTFMHEGEVLYTTRVLEGGTCTDPVTEGTVTEPTKEMTAQYTFENSGWSLTDGGEADPDALTSITDDTIVYAAFEGTLRKYTARFFDGDTLLSTVQVNYGEEAPQPDITDITPEGYSFGWWLPLDLTITGDTDYSATWLEGNIVVVMPRQTLSFAVSNDGSSYITADGTDALMATTIHADPLVAGNAYTIEWDGVEYLCESRDLNYGTGMTASMSGAVGNNRVVHKVGLLGGLLVFTVQETTTTDEPFLIVNDNNNASIFLYAMPDDGSTHTVMIYQMT